MVEETGGGGGDDFSVDELLDFSNGYSETEEQLTEERQEAEEGKLETTSLLQERSGAVSLSKREEFGSLDDGELCFEAEGLESLEWLSHFMDDSISDYSHAGKLPDAAAAAAKKEPCFTTPVQTKARTTTAPESLLHQFLLGLGKRFGYETEKACCGTGGEYNFSLRQMCGAPNVTVCANPGRHVSWDGVHMTQQGYKVMAGWLIRNTFPQLRC